MLENAYGIYRYCEIDISLLDVLITNNTKYVVLICYKSIGWKILVF